MYLHRRFMCVLCRGYRRKGLVCYVIRALRSCSVGSPSHECLSARWRATLSSACAIGYLFVMPPSVQLQQRGLCFIVKLPHQATPTACFSRMSCLKKSSKPPASAVCASEKKNETETKTKTIRTKIVHFDLEKNHHKISSLISSLSNNKANGDTTSCADAGRY